MRKKRTPGLVTLAVLTAITTISWVFFDVYRSISKPTPINVPADILQPFTPNLDNTALDKIKNSKFLSKDELINLFASTSSALPKSGPSDLFTTFTTPVEVQTSTEASSLSPV